MLSAHPWLRRATLLPLLALLLALVPTPAARAADPASVTIAGTFQNELGCTKTQLSGDGDFAPDCGVTHLTLIGNGVWRGEFTIPAGSYEYKAALNDSWAENYGRNATRDGANIPLVLAATTPVRFYFDRKNNTVFDSVNSKVAVVAGNFQSELGCPADWQPSCVISLMTDPDGDGKYTFSSTSIPVGNYAFKVVLNEDDSYKLAYPSSDFPFSVTSVGQKVTINWNSTTNEVTFGDELGDLSKAKAHWLSRDTIAWNVAGTPADVYQLVYSPTAGLTLGPNGIVGGTTINLTYDPAGLSADLQAKYPHLAGFKAFKISSADLAAVPAILKGQFAVQAANATPALIDATGVQIPGVLDDLYTYNGPLGPTFAAGVPTLRLWAPTAQSVMLHVFDDATTTVSSTVAMDYDSATGVWSATGDANWQNKYYLFDVQVFTRATNSVVQNLVTDPYSLNLSINSGRSQIVDLNDSTLKPAGWDTTVKPPLDAPEDIALYELHIRDFSANDPTVPEAERGTFKAFTERDSNGMKHLRTLAAAGMTHIHLLPAFDCASINEDKSTWQSPQGDLASFAPDSDQQQAATKAVAANDGFNWCYDPFHYTTPEGSYSTDPNGTTRILEFREMVQALNQSGLRVVMDVVYNHTNAAGQNDKSVLDKVVPGYYQRLNLEGGVETSTCCQNTATEHAMMEKLMVDSLTTWATAYKVDGFRFDLMGHHMLANMLKVRDTLQALTPANDGVDGSKIYIYGEGWNFGEVADNARGVNAIQRNLAGSGIGSFNDRIRDAARGGSPFSDPREQGFATGLFTDPNSFGQGTAEEQRARLLLKQDQLRASLAGSLKDYQFVNSTGTLTVAAAIDYNGQPAAYTSDPQEIINYVEAHDNQTLFDAVQLKAAATDSLSDRIRMDQVANDVVMLSQGIPFFQAGQDILRSKSFDENSYDSGDWWNRLDWSFQSNNFGVGLPPTGSDKWPLYQPLLADPALKPTTEQIQAAATSFQEMLRIRKSSPLFRLRTAADIQERLSFLDTGANQTPGLIVMRLTDPRAIRLDNPYGEIVVVFNASDEAQQISAEALKGANLRLHPIQADSADPVVRTSSFDSASGTLQVPARTTAVFVQATYQLAIPLVGR